MLVHPKNATIWRCQRLNDPWLDCVESLGWQVMHTNYWPVETGISFLYNPATGFIYVLRDYFDRWDELIAAVVLSHQYQKQLARAWANVQENTEAVTVHAARVVVDRGLCDLAPAGWKCSREKGHDGPCAAWPYDSQT